MNRLIRAGLIGSALAMAASSWVVAKTHSASDPFTGTWQLNTAASNGTPALKSDTRVYSVDGIKVTMHSNGVDAAGKPVSSSYDAAYDGKSYPKVGYPMADSIALTKVDSHTVTAILRKGSTVTATARATVSHDGKHLTIARKTGTPPGKLIKTTVVYDRK